MAGTAELRLLLTAREAARALAMSERTLWSLTKRETERGIEGEIPALRIGRSIRYDVRDLQAWIDAHKGNGGRQAEPMPLVMQAWIDNHADS